MKYAVFNATDGIPACANSFSSIKGAKKFIEEFPKRYEGQGYYFTNRMIRIDPKSVELVIYDKDRNEVFNNQYGVEE